jgi:hypothetical protein
MPGLSGCRREPTEESLFCRAADRGNRRAFRGRRWPNELLEDANANVECIAKRGVQRAPGQHDDITRLPCAGCLDGGLPFLAGPDLMAFIPLSGRDR